MNHWTDKLTKRERQLLERIIKTGMQKVAAAEIGMANKTASAHMANIARKAGVDRRLHAILEFDRFVRSGAETAAA